MKNNKEVIFPPIYKNDVILPLFTEDLRNYLNEKLNNQSKRAYKKMVEDGWGKSKFGEPNLEYYGNYIHRFIERFSKYLNMETLEVYKEQKFNGKLYMRCGDIIDNEFEIYPLNFYEDPYAFEYFQGFKFKLDNYGKDFYKIGHYN